MGVQHQDSGQHDNTHLDELHSSNSPGIFKTLCQLFFQDITFHMTHFPKTNSFFCRIKIKEENHHFPTANLLQFQLSLDIFHHS